MLEPIENMFRKGPLVGWDRLNRGALPRQIFDLDGQEIVFGSALRKGMRPPVLFTAGVLSGDLIPATSWGSSLANLLTKSNWDALRKPVIERNSGVCEYCGRYVGGALEVHEVWNYSDLASRDELNSLADDMLYFGKQSLIGLKGVCRDCHNCFHFGLADMKGYGNAVRERLSLINGWPLEEVEGYLSLLFERHEILSRHHWYLDLSMVSAMIEGLKVQRSWKRDKTSPHILTRTNDYGDSITLIVNCKWQFFGDKEWSYFAESELQ